jgi:hypothetical protein
MAGTDVYTGAVIIPGEDYQRIQQLVDNGQHFWRLSPVRTAQEIGTVHLGFRTRDAYTFVKQYPDADSGMMYAIVRVKHLTCTYLVELCQPEKQGKGGIWVVTSVTKG